MLGGGGDLSIPIITAYIKRKLPAIGSLFVGVLVGLLFAQSLSKDVSFAFPRHALGNRGH
jgi:hypothetical protein